MFPWCHVVTGVTQSDDWLIGLLLGCELAQSLLHNCTLSSLVVDSHLVCSLVVHFRLLVSRHLALDMAAPPVPFHTLFSTATNWHTTVITNLDGPTTSEFKSHTEHLCSNLILFACSEPIVYKKFVIDQLGINRKWCRSLCYKGQREMLVDLGPKGNSATRAHFLMLFQDKSGE